VVSGGGRTCGRKGGESPWSGGGENLWSGCRTPSSRRVRLPCGALHRPPAWALSTTHPAADQLLACTGPARQAQATSLAMLHFKGWLPRALSHCVFGPGALAGGRWGM